MNSSREWGDDLNRISFEGDPELRRRVVRCVIVLLIVVLVAGLAWAGWRFLRSRCQPLLVEARLLVQTAMENPLPTPEQPATNTPVVKSEWDKTPRNAPCPCGSGKKFKQCHGR